VTLNRKTQVQSLAGPFFISFLFSFFREGMPGKHITVFRPPTPPKKKEKEKEKEKEQTYKCNTTVNKPENQVPEQK